MKALLLVNKSENTKVEIARDILNEQNLALEIIIFAPPFTEHCSQSEEIKNRIIETDAVVYFASHENENNRCLDGALIEAARLDKKVICIWLDETAKLNPSFEGLGDCLISNIQQLPEALTGQIKDWENSDGTLKQDRPFKRYKCGSKQ